MRGLDDQGDQLFSYVSIEDKTHRKHPLRLIRAVVNDCLSGMSSDFDALYARDGRPSIAPERLIWAMLLQAFYSIRSERQWMEQMQFNLLYCWLVGLSPDERVWDASTFSNNRNRLLEAEFALVTVLATVG